MLIADTIQIGLLVVLLLQLGWAIISFRRAQELQLRAQELQLQAFKADHERRRKQATLEFMNAISDRYKTALRKFDEKHGRERVVDLAAYDEDDRETVRQYLSEIERACAGVNAGVYDYGILKKMNASMLLSNFQRFGQYIEKAQSQRASLYAEYTHVAARLKADETLPFAATEHVKHSKDT